jgi:hypothetical protein
MSLARAAFKSEAMAYTVSDRNVQLFRQEQGVSQKRSLESADEEQSPGVPVRAPRPGSPLSV